MGRPIRSARDAELAARDWMIMNGFLDARCTGLGADGGIDVVSSRAVAQVKAQAKPVSPHALQALAGIAAVERKSGIFFALAGYTTDAKVWADRAGLALFTFDLEGDASPLNRHAKALATQAIRWGSEFPLGLDVSHEGNYLAAALSRPSLGMKARVVEWEVAARVDRGSLWPAIRTFGPEGAHLTGTHSLPLGADGDASFGWTRGRVAMLDGSRVGIALHSDMGSLDPEMRCDATLVLDTVAGDASILPSAFPAAPTMGIAALADPLVGGALSVQDDFEGSLVCRDSVGRCRWRTPHRFGPDDMAEFVVRCGTTVVAVTGDYYALEAFDLRSGELLWAKPEEVPCDGGRYEEVFPVSPSLLLAWQDNGALHAFESTTGSRLWSQTLPSRPSRVAETGDAATLLVGHLLARVNVADGAIEATLDLGRDVDGVVGAFFDADESFWFIGYTLAEHLVVTAVKTD